MLFHSISHLFEISATHLCLLEMMIANLQGTILTSGISSTVKLKLICRDASIYHSTLNMSVHLPPADGSLDNNMAHRVSVFPLKQL